MDSGVREEEEERGVRLRGTGRERLTLYRVTSVSFKNRMTRE